jgi:hypothetical protein
MFLVLDNTAPGATREQRGLNIHSVESSNGSDSPDSSNSKYEDAHLEGYAFSSSVNK